MPPSVSLYCMQREIGSLSGAGSEALAAAEAVVGFEAYEVYPTGVGRLRPVAFIWSSEKMLLILKCYY